MINFVTKDTPITMLTVDQFVKFIAETPELKKLLKDIVTSVLTDQDIEDVITKRKQPRYVHGISGIRSLLIVVTPPLTS